MFEAVINAVHRAAPSAAIAFNTRPDDSADAAVLSRLRELIAGFAGSAAAAAYDAAVEHAVVLWPAGGGVMLGSVREGDTAARDDARLIVQRDGGNNLLWAVDHDDFLAWLEERLDPGEAADQQERTGEQHAWPAPRRALLGS